MGRAAMAIVAASVLVAACGGSDDAADEAATATSAPGDAAAVTTEPATTTVADDTATTEAPATTTSPTTTVVEESVADAISIEPLVDVRLGAATVFSPVTEPAPVAAGDVVRTDGTGFAEIAYFDGSRTRLDVDTEFEVLELVDDVDESAVRTEMGVGRTWHRVQELGEGGEFSVETSVATAVVQGTAFSVECATEDACTFMVVEGALRIDLPDGTSIDLVAPSALVVDADDGPGEPFPVPFDGAFGDEWLFDNAGRDDDAGFTPAAEVYQAYGPSYGSVGGTFSGTRTVTSNDCVTFCSSEPPVGDVADRSYTFEIDCSRGVPCAGTIETEYREDQEILSQTTDLVFDGTSYRWSVEWSTPACLTDSDGDGSFENQSGNLDIYVEWVMTPSEAEIIDDRWVVTEMTDLGQGRATNTVTDPGACAGPDYWQGSTSTYDIVVTRQP